MFLLPKSETAFVDQRFGLIRENGFPLIGGVDLHLAKTGLLQQRFHLAGAEEVELEVHLLLPETALLVREGVDSGCILGLCIRIVAIPGFQRQFHTVFQGTEAVISGRGESCRVTVVSIENTSTPPVTSRRQSFFRIYSRSLRSVNNPMEQARIKM